MAMIHKGVWAQEDLLFLDSERMDLRLRRLASAGVTHLFPCVHRPASGRGVNFLSDLTDVNPDYPAGDPMRELIRRAQDHGIQTHPWFCLFKPGAGDGVFRKYPDSHAVFRGHSPYPEWDRREMKDGRCTDWVCALQPQVQRHLLELLGEFAERYRPSGLHLDYVRTGSVCSCGYCTEEMARFGIDLDPETYDPLNAWWWTRWRVDRLTGFVRDVRALTRRLGLALSAAVKCFWPRQIPTGAQDWVSWAGEGLLDDVIPMIYSDSDEFVRQTIALHRTFPDLNAGRCQYWAGLKKCDSVGAITADQLRRQIALADELGAGGVAVFRENALTDEDVKVLKESL